MLTILECVQAACNELGLTAPSTVYSATDLQTIQLGALMNADLRDLRLMHQWSDLHDGDVFGRRDDDHGDTNHSGHYAGDVVSGVGIVHQPSHARCIGG